MAELRFQVNCSAPFLLRIPAGVRQRPGNIRLLPQIFHNPTNSSKLQTGSMKAHDGRQIQALPRVADPDPRE